MKLKFYVFLVFLLIGVYTVEAQTWDWTSHIGSTGQDSNPLVSYDNQGNVFVTGNYGADLSLSGQDLPFTTWSAHFLAKYDLTGQLIWAKPYGNHRSRCNAIDTDESGNLYVTGDWNGSSIDIDGTILSTDATHGSTFIAKYDNDGNLLWAKNEFEGLAIDKIDVDNSGNIAFAGNYYRPTGLYFGGTTYAYDNTLNSNLSDGAVGKFDANGEALWLHTFNGPDRDDVGAIGTDADNNVYVAGRFKSDILSLDNSTTIINKVDSTSEGFDLFIVKYDYLGNQEWIKSEGGNATVAESIPLLTVDEIGNVTVISDFRLENLLIDGTKNIEGKDWCTTTLIAQFDKDGLLKMATSAFGSNRIIGRAITSHNGKIYLAGAFGQEFSSAGNTLVTNGGFDVYVAEIDNQGNWNWAISFGGDVLDIAQNMTFDDAGNLYLTAITNSTNLNVNNTTYAGIGLHDYFFGKLELGVSGANSLINEQILVNAFPNPTNDKVLLNLGDKEVSGVIDLVNISGEILKRLDFINQVDLEFDLSTYPKGIYFVKINSLEGTRVVKVVKE